MNNGFDELARQHWPEAFRFCLGLTGNCHDAEELSQEGFARALRGYHRFRGASTFRTWLFSILIHCHRDTIRRRVRWDASRDRIARDDEVPHEGYDEVAADDLKGRILAHLADLPPRQREVLSLHALEGLDYRRIAETLGITYDDVKVNLSLARRRLREVMK